jgi:hypothetical protein
MTQELQDGWLEQLIELERKATPGRWVSDTYNTVFAGSESTHDLVEICTIPDEPETGESRKRTRDEWYPESANNLELIVALRNAAPALLDIAQKAQACDTLKRENAELQQALGDLLVCYEDQTEQRYCVCGSNEGRTHSYACIVQMRAQDAAREALDAARKEQG